MIDKIIYLKFEDILMIKDGLTIKKGNIQLKRGG